METILPKLDHNQKELNAAFGLTEYQRHYCKTAIMFEMLSLHLMVRNLYDNVNDAPSNMSTITGVLEHAMSHMRSKEEQAYLLFIFNAVYNNIDDTLDNLHESSEKADTSSIEGTLKHFINQVQALPLRLALDVIKEEGHDFQNFVKRVLPEDRFNEVREAMESNDEDPIERLIKEALRKKDEDSDN